MAMCACDGCMMQCSFGAAPGRLTATPGTIQVGGKMVCTIMDNVPGMNITPFGACAVMLGAPCVPATVAPWVPGSPTVMVGGKPALNINSKLMCAIGGMIQIIVPAQFTADVP